MRTASKRRGLLATTLSLGVAAAPFGTAAVDASPAKTPAGADAGDGGATRILRVRPEQWGVATPSRDGGAISPFAPDPEPLVAGAAWVFDLRWDRGELFLLGVRRIERAEPEPTPRVMGRFAIELYEREVLIERVRFDFPFLGAAPPAADAGYFSPPELERRLVTRIGAIVPATQRGDRLDLWDRATGLRYPLPWPPTVTQADAATR